MPYLVVEDFRGGQDDRRADTASPAGTCRRILNAHLTRGGEIEKRKAFVSTYTLPADTFGMAATSTTLYVFGSATAPTMPSGVTYQRLQHPTAEAMTDVLSVDVFDDKLYVAARFADSSIYHFYDGTRVDDWADGKARGGFDITAGSAALKSSTSFSVTGGTSNPGTNKVTSITVGGSEILGADVDWATSNDATATAIAAQINTFSSTWDAAAVGATVTITAATATAANNGLAVVVTNAGDVTTSAAADTAGGSGPNSITSITVDGVEVLGATVNWATSNSAFATALAAQITSYTSSPNYAGSSEGETVNIIAATAGTGPNGYTVTVTTTGNVAAGSVRAMANGSDTGSTFQPGTFVRAFRDKMYAVSGSLWHFSALSDPTGWQTADLGAGFINMSTQASGSEELTSMESYYGYMAIFSRKNIQVWLTDPDPELYTQFQIIRNTGTYAPRSVEAFGDGDVAYLSRNGVRALRARDSSNAAVVTELSAPIDSTIIAYVASLTTTQQEAAVATLEPIDNRYWLAVGERIFVYSSFSGSRIAAWSEYDVGFEVSDFAVLNDRVYARSGDTLYLYGGAANATYDDSEVVVEMPFLDGGTPATSKAFSAIDATVQGEWAVEVAYNPELPAQFDDVGIIWGPTWQRQAIGMQGQSTHFKMRFTHEAAEYARLSNFAVHYDLTEAS